MDCPTGPKCQNANSAQGHSLANGARGGVCSHMEPWKFYGGFGGGGASCGPGGGGGAGLKGEMAIYGEIVNVDWANVVFRRRWWKFNQWAGRMELCQGGEGEILDQ